MNFFGDYHTHTVYSKKPYMPMYHAKGTIEENADFAKKMGLKELAITDHGFSHKFYGCSRKKLKETKQEIERISKKYDLKIYFGVEANFVSQDGTIDVVKTDMDYLDIVLCGYHTSARPKTIKDLFQIFIPNFFAKFFRTSKTLKQRNTNMLLNAIEKNNIDVITHMNSKIKCDVELVAKKALEKGTLIELNEKHCDFSKDEISNMVKMGVKFLVDSDAHRPEKIGKFSKIEKLIEDNSIPKENIVNLEQLPSFLNQKIKAQKEK